MAESISMKKLGQWAGEYEAWKKQPENRHGTTDEAITLGVVWIHDFLKMVEEKRKGQTNWTVRKGVKR